MEEDNKKESNQFIDNNDLSSPNINSSNRTTENESLEPLIQKKPNGFKFPSAYTILMIIEIIFFILTFIIPKGKFDTIEYSDKQFIIKSFGKPDIKVNASQEYLDEKNIKIPLKNFEKGLIKDPLAIPDTYKRIDEKNLNVFSLFAYPVKGLINSCGIAFFLFVLGGSINILIEMNALNSGIEALGRATKGNDFILLIFVLIISSFGGTTFGFMEEVLPFYPIIVPIFIKNGYDALLGMGGLFFGSMIGCMFSTVNAFSVIIASYSAGIEFVDGIYFRLVCLVLGDILSIIYLYFYYLRIKKDKTKSIIYDLKDELEEKFLKKEKENTNNDSGIIDEENQLLKEKSDDNNHKFTLKQKIGLILLFIGFIVMITGILVFDWYFENMTAVFVVATIIFIFLYGKGESKGIEVFMKGAGEFIGVSIIIGLARGINITLNEGNISDTILNSLTKIIDGLPKIVFTLIMLIVFIFLGFFIQSSSGLAVLSMPVFAPLADKANCSRSIVINTYMFGQYLIGFIAPTGIILIALEVVGIPYNYWLKFIWPFLIFCFIFLIILVILNVALFG